MFLLTTDTFKPSGCSYKTCRIVFTSHDYGLTFHIRKFRWWGWSYTTENCQVCDCFAICERETAEYFEGDHGTISSDNSLSLMSSLVGSCLTSLDEGTKGPIFWLFRLTEWSWDSNFKLAASKFTATWFVYLKKSTADLQPNKLAVLRPWSHLWHPRFRERFVLCLQNLVLGGGETILGCCPSLRGRANHPRQFVFYHIIVHIHCTSLPALFCPRRFLTQRWEIIRSLHKKHRTLDSLCMHLADPFREVAVIPMCIFPLLKFSDSLHSLWLAWLCFSFARGLSFPLDTDKISSLYLQFLFMFLLSFSFFWCCTEYVLHFVSLLNLGYVSLPWLTC